MRQFRGNYFIITVTCTAQVNFYANTADRYPQMRESHTKTSFHKSALIFFAARNDNFAKCNPGASLHYFRTFRLPKNRSETSSGLLTPADATFSSTWKHGLRNEQFVSTMAVSAINTNELFNEDQLYSFYGRICQSIAPLV